MQIIPKECFKNILLVSSDTLLTDGLNNIMGKYFNTLEKKITIDNVNDQFIKTMANKKLAKNKIDDFNYDLIIIDVNIRNLNHLYDIPTIKTRFLGIKVIVLTTDNPNKFYDMILNNNIDGYITKYDKKETIIEAIETIADGRLYMSNETTDILVEYIRESKGKSKTILTKTEERILALLSNDASNKEIAIALGIKVKTVDNHKNNMVHKLNLKSTRDLYLFSIDKLKSNRK